MITKENKGITIISLVIMIIVLLVLSGITITALTSKNSIINKANITKIATEFSKYNDELEQWKMAKEIEENGEFQEETLSAGKTNLSYNGEKKDGNIKNIIPDLTDEHLDEIEIVKGNLILNTTSNSKTEAAKIAGISYNPYQIVDGELKSTGSNLNLVTSNGILTIPENVVKISSGAFSGVTGLKTIIIPGSVKEIGGDAFSYNSTLEKVVMQEGITTIDGAAFRNCYNLQSIGFPESVNQIGGAAFAYCTKVENITLPSSLKKISNSTFQGCVSLQKVNFGDNLISIGANAFLGCSKLNNIFLTKNVKEIGAGAFGECWKLDSFNIDKSNNSFTNVNDIIYTMDKKNIVLLLSNNASKKNITIEENVEKIDNNVFSTLKNLEKIILPSTLKSISGLSFGTIQNLSEIVIADSNQNFKSVDNCILSKDETILFYVAPNRTTFTTPAKVKTMKSYSIYGRKIGKITIGDSVKIIESCCLQNIFDTECEVSIGKGVSSLDSGFKDFANTKKLKFAIDKDNNYYCTLDNFIVSKDKKELITYINMQENMTIPDGIEIIDNLSIAGIINITLPKTIKEIKKLSDNNFSSIDIPKSIEKINKDAFSNTPNLEKIIIHKKENEIADAPWGSSKGSKVVGWVEN